MILKVKNNMWRYIDTPRVVAPNGTEVAEFDYNVYDGTTDSYGSGSNSVVISEIIQRVRSLFEAQLPIFDFDNPIEEEIYILNMPREVYGAQILRQESPSGPYYYSSFIDPHEDRIILLYPPRRMTPIQALSHELGHWFYDRIIDDIVHENNDWNHRDDINGFGYYTEIAALYCQEEISGPILNRRDYHITVQRMLQELNFFRSISNDVISLIIQKLIQK